MKYRSHEEIINAVLTSIGAGETKSRIMRRAGLSYNQVKEYFDLLIVKDLIVFQEPVGIYRITAKGEKFMAVFGEINSMIDSALGEKPRMSQRLSSMPFNY